MQRTATVLSIIAVATFVAAGGIDGKRNLSEAAAGAEPAQSYLANETLPEGHPPIPDRYLMLPEGHPPIAEGLPRCPRESMLMEPEMERPDRPDVEAPELVST